MITIKYKLVFVLTMALSLTALNAQESEGHFVKDKKNNCTVWFKHYFEEDSVLWTGSCLNNLATGQGTLTGFTNGKKTCSYTGHMLNGKPNGTGVFTFSDKRTLSGNFLNGEPLFLNDVCLKHLYKHIVSENDSSNLYVGDNNLKQLYYHALVPDGTINGALVLLPGTWETTEHLISSNQQLCQMAYNRGLAVLVLSVNQRLTLNNTALSVINALLSDATTRYKIPKNKTVMGGWSMGGLFSLRYTELANQDSTKTAIKPAGVFSCDGPCDLENVYDLFLKKLNKFKNNSEAAYGIAELSTYCGGRPAEAKEKYQHYSCYTHADRNGGNAQYLTNTPVRIYGDVDVNWWMEQRDLDLYDMNALDQSAMILYLKDKGNRRAEFINAYKKGYRLEGNRHPHSWSIVEPEDCLKWILSIFN